MTGARPLVAALAQDRVVQRACCDDCTQKEEGALQARLRLGGRGDRFEREADSVADSIVGGGQPGMLSRMQADRPQREAVTGSVPSGAAGSPPCAALAGAAASVRSGGRPLPASERAYFEPRFGRSFGHVRIHTDPAAGLAARSIGARAFTLGADIAFAPGEFSPDSQSGRHLIAHELTHTLQQGAGPAATVRRQPFGENDDPFGEERRETDPRGPGHHSTLTYRDSRNLLACVRQRGDDQVNRTLCRNQVLGEPLPETRRVAGVSTPVPFLASDRAGGGVTYTIGHVHLTILPDARTDDPDIVGITNISTPAFRWEGESGRISSFSFDPAPYHLTIQTTYGPGASAAGLSGYGRGTTDADRAIGQTSLGFHEGSHGRDFIAFLENNPYPQFDGRVGDRIAAFRRKLNRFTRDETAYVRRMNRLSELRTDCPGTSIDRHNAANNRLTTICRPRRGDPAL